MQEFTYRSANEQDLPFLNALIAEDAIATARDQAPHNLAQSQSEALRAINADPNHALYIVERAGAPIGSFQLSFIPGVGLRGGWRGQIESVRVKANERGNGIGEAMMRWAIARCKERGCGLVQLTSDRQRLAAHRFYERLGFSATHSGFKLTLDGSD